MTLTRLWIGGLPESVDEEWLRRRLTGAVEVELPPPKVAGQCRGFGFATVPEQNVEALIKRLHRSRFRGNVLQLARANPSGVDSVRRDIAERSAQAITASAPTEPMPASIRLRDPRTRKLITVDCLSCKSQRLEFNSSGLEMSEGVASTERSESVIQVDDHGTKETLGQLSKASLSSDFSWGEMQNPHQQYKPVELSSTSFLQKPFHWENDVAGALELVSEDEKSNSAPSESLSNSSANGVAVGHPDFLCASASAGASKPAAAAKQSTDSHASSNSESSDDSTASNDSSDGSDEADCNEESSEFSGSDDNSSDDKDESDSSQSSGEENDESDDDDSDEKDDQSSSASEDDDINENSPSEASSDSETSSDDDYNFSDGFSDDKKDVEPDAKDSDSADDSDDDNFSDGVSDDKKDVEPDAKDSDSADDSDDDSDDDSGDGSDGSNNDVTSSFSKQKPRKQLLSDSDSESHMDMDLHERKEFLGPEGRELMARERAFGGDERFRMDERFRELDVDAEMVPVEQETDVVKEEKQSALNVLGKILGEKFEAKEKTSRWTVKRFDPSNPAFQLKEDKADEEQSEQEESSSSDEEEEADAERRSKKIKLSNSWENLWKSPAVAQGGEGAFRLLPDIDEAEKPTSDLSDSDESIDSSDSEPELVNDSLKSFREAVRARVIVGGDQNWDLAELSTDPLESFCSEFSFRFHRQEPEDVLRENSFQLRKSRLAALKNFLVEQAERNQHKQRLYGRQRKQKRRRNPTTK